MTNKKYNNNGIYNHSADENNSLENNQRGGEQSWMEDRFSVDDTSNNNFKDSGSNGQVAPQPKGVKNVNKGSVNSLNNKNNNSNDIIPERRRKYLNNASDDMQGNGVNNGVGQQAMDNHEHQDENSKGSTMHRKNNKNNVHLQPLDHNPHTRNSSVPPMLGN